jgi:hypothetical protein
LAALAAIAALPAWADPPPKLQPTRDVDVTYRVPVPGAGDASLLQRLRWSAARHAQRVDMPTSGNWMVLDFAHHRMTLVRDDSREVVDLPAPLAADQPGAGAGFRRVGTDSAAGLPCTLWHMVDTRGAETLACYTDDGVLLRATSGNRTMMEAVSVTYAAQDPAIFDTPAGYTQQRSSR